MLLLGEKKNIQAKELDKLIQCATTVHTTFHIPTKQIDKTGTMHDTSYEVQDFFSILFQYFYTTEKVTIDL